jgi:hypothetical protein
MAASTFRCRLRHGEFVLHINLPLFSIHVRFIFLWAEEVLSLIFVDKL